MHFLGIVSYYNSFCKNFSTVVAPLTDVLKGKIKSEWSSACQRAFENVKGLLVASPVLAAPQLDQPFKLKVDPSNVGEGAVLMQENKEDHPIAYFSKKFNPHQLNYSVIEKQFTKSPVWSQ